MTDVYSLHTFMFPFRWDYIVSDTGKENLSYSSRTHLEDFDRVFSKCNTLKRKVFNTYLDSENYNEYTYFHEFVRRALYDTGNIRGNANYNEVLYYDLDGIQGEDYYCIELLTGESFTLFPENFCAHIFSTGIGILSYNLKNTTKVNEEDILKINEFGRRIYPQFLSKNSTNDTKNVFLANRIHGKIGNIYFDEDFSQYHVGVGCEYTFLPPDHIKKIFGFKGNDKESADRKFVFRTSHERKGNIRISKLTDDRMFYLCYYHNKKLTQDLAKIKTNTHQYAYLTDDFWYAFIFGDKDKTDITIKNPELQKRSLEKHSYARWVETESIDKKNKLSFVKSGTLYGMSRDSFVCVGNWDALGIHMTTMYYQMAILCLAQRASVLRFSYEVGLITDQLEQNKDATRDIKDLYKNYIQFINKIYFREVTSQIQGIEMYNQFQEVMGLEKDVKDLDNEIRELHTYISMVEQSNLSKAAIWFLPAGVLVGILGMNTFPDGFYNITKYPDWGVWGWILFVIVLSVFSAVFLTRYFNRKTK